MYIALDGKYLRRRNTITLIWSIASGICTFVGTGVGIVSLILYLRDRKKKSEPSDSDR